MFVITLSDLIGLFLLGCIAIGCVIWVGVMYIRVWIYRRKNGKNKAAEAALKGEQDG